MNLSSPQIQVQLSEALSAPLSDDELAELLLRYAYLEEQLAVLRASELLAEEPSLPPSLEELP